MCHKLHLHRNIHFLFFFSPAVKPHAPTNVKAVSKSSGVLMVTWEPPSLPVEGLQCQFRYHSLSTVRAQPEWKVSLLFRWFNNPRFWLKAWTDAMDCCPYFETIYSKYQFAYNYWVIRSGWFQQSTTNSLPVIYCYFIVKTGLGWP